MCRELPPPVGVDRRRRPTPQRPVAPTGAGGTPTPTPTTPSTATSSATPTSSGARSGCARQDARLLGDVAGRDVLEVGCGAAMCSRWLVGQGARPVAFDLSAGMLRHAQAAPNAPASTCRSCRPTRSTCRFATAAFDIAFTAFGAVAVRRRPRAGDARGRPGAAARRALGVRDHAPDPLVRSPTIPARTGCARSMPYWDRTPYVEFAADGTPTYVEHHRTLGDRVREIVGAGLRLVDLVEPEWPAGHTAGVGPVVAAARRDPARHRDLRCV